MITACRNKIGQFLFLLIFAVPLSAQTTYYVSSSTGNDSNNGRSEAAAWKTLDKVSRTNFGTGDRILFKRGDTLYGEFSKPLWEKGYVGTASNRFYIGAYGTGDRPIIMMDCSNLVWKKRAGYESVYAAPAIGFCYATYGFEYINGTWTQMTQYSDNVSDIDNPVMLSQYLNRLTPSSYGPAYRDSPIDTVYCRTHDGLPPKIKILRQNMFKADYLTIEDLDIRNGFHALNPYPANNSIFRNLYMRNFLGITFFLAGGSSNNLVEACRADSGAYTAFYCWYSHRNLYRYDSVYVVRDTIMGIYSDIEQAGFGAERDTATVWEYCYVNGADMSGWDTFYNFNDTIRYCKVENSPRGYMLNGVGWVAHDNTYTTTGISGDLAFKVDISYVFSGRTYLLTGGRTHVYNNTITANSSGLWASKCVEGSSILFENNTVYGTVSNTNFNRLETVNTISRNNTFYGPGRWLTGAWPNQTSYSTLSSLLSATGYEQGSVWHPGSSTAAITVTPSSRSFGNVFVNATSQTSFTISGANLTPATGYITITAPAGYTVSQSSSSGFASSITCAYSSSTLSARAIYIRFSPTAVQSYNGSIRCSGGNAADKNVAVTGTGISQTTPVITVNRTSFSFGNVIIHTNSSEQTYTLAGSNLNPASGNITITAPSSEFQISLIPGTGFSSSLNVPYASGTLSSTTIYVRFSPALVQSYSGNIANTGGGAEVQNILVTGSGISSTVPVISVSPVLLAFSTVHIGTKSSERIYTLQGSYLSPASGNITITAPAGFQVSETSNSGFSSTLSIPYTGGNLPAKLIYTQFQPAAEQSYSGNISNSGGGAPAQNVTVTGAGISSTSAALTVSPTSISFGDIIVNTSSGEKSFSLTGLNLNPLSDSLTVTATDGFFISITPGTGFTSSKKIAYINGMLIAKNIYVRFSPATVQNYYGAIISEGGGSASQTVTVSGSSVPLPTPILTVNPTFLSFGNVVNSTISNEKNYVISGSYLNPASGNITITAPAGFQVSVSAGSGFGSSITLPYSGGILLPTTIYGRFLPTQLQAYNDGILNEGGGAETVVLPVSGKGVLPEISVSPSSLSFSSVVINTISTERTYILTGSDLAPANGNILVEAPSTAYEVSLTTGSGFGSSVSVSYSGGAISSPVTIFVRFRPAALESYSGYIKNIAGDGTTEYVSVNGIGVSESTSLLETEPTSLLFGNVAVNTVSSRKYYSLSGVNLVPEDGSIYINAPAGFEVSAESGYGFDSSLVLNYTGGLLTATSIYVRFCPTMMHNYSGNIANIGGGASAESVYVSGSSLPPVLIMSADSLPFGGVTINTSSIKSYILTGFNLQPESDTVKLAAPAGFTVSIYADSAFSNLINLPYTANTLSSREIFVKFIPEAMQNYIGNIVHSCGGKEIQNLQVSGECAVPSLYVNLPSINFDNVPVNTVSDELSYQIRGSNLEPHSGNIIVTAVSGFKVSMISGIGFSSSISIPYTDGNLSSTIIYVHFYPEIVQDYAGVISNDGGSATTLNVMVSGIGVNAPFLSVDPASISFGYLAAGEISSVRSYILTGTNLLTGRTITINSPKGFQVSASSGAGFDTSISVSSSNVASLSVPVYVCFSPAAAENYSGEIINIGGGAPAFNVAVNGIGLPLDKIVQLGQNYPNPFNPTTRIPYSIFKKSWVKLTIYNILGQRIKTLIDEEQDVGYYQPEFDISRDNNGHELSSGIYFYRLEIAGTSQTKKFILIK